VVLRENFRRTIYTSPNEILLGVDDYFQDIDVEARNHLRHMKLSNKYPHIKTVIANAVSVWNMVPEKSFVDVFDLLESGRIMEASKLLVIQFPHIALSHNKEFQAITNGTEVAQLSQTESNPESGQPEPIPFDGVFDVIIKTKDGGSSVSCMVSYEQLQPALG